MLSLPICNAGTFRTPFVRIFHLSYTLASKITGDPCLPFLVPQSVCDSLLALRVQAISAAVVSQAEEKEEKVRQKKLPNIGNAIQRGSSLSEACISILYTFEVSFSVPARSPLPLPAVSSTLQKSYFAKRRSPQNGFVSFSPVPFFLQASWHPVDSFPIFLACLTLQEACSVKRRTFLTPVPLLGQTQCCTFEEAARKYLYWPHA